MANKIIIKNLLLKGINKDYSYSFKPGLNIIEGPIATGKTSLLDFIDYCFGARSHPSHIEIQNKVRSVLLELKIDNNPIVIERPVFSNELKTTIHECSLDQLIDPHQSTLLSSRQLVGQDSISSFILNKLNLFDISLKESLSKDATDTNIMSFRNLMWFCYLKNERLDNKYLLFENEPIKKIKLIQVFDVIFKIHDNELAIISQQINELQMRLKEITNKLSILNQFLSERKIPSKHEIRDRLIILKQSEAELIRKLKYITTTLKGESNVAQQIRANLLSLDDDLKKLYTQKRNLETLLKRLLPLRGQYSEDIKKMYFLQQAKKIIDPLNIVRCPVCFEEVGYRDFKSNLCSFCGQVIKSEEIPNFDIKKEIKSIDSKIKELNSFIRDTDLELNELIKVIEEKKQKVKILRNKLDEAINDYISPYISERDGIIGELSRIGQEIKDIQTQLDLHQGIEDRIKYQSEIENNLKNKQIELEKLKNQVQERGEILKKINERFKTILEIANFPKLINPKVDQNLTPFIRDIEYRKIGSGGALTLISISWFLSIFENAIEIDGEHPGFIMIDSPQKNIGIRASIAEQEFRDTKIVEGLYRHIIEKSKEYGENSQILIVDNEAPLIAQEYVTIRFTRNKEKPPYGLIDDEIE